MANVHSFLKAGNLIIIAGSAKLISNFLDRDFVTFCMTIYPLPQNNNGTQSPEI